MSAKKKAYSKAARAAMCIGKRMAQRARCKKYYAKNAAFLRACARARNALTEPKSEVVALYTARLEHRLLNDTKAKLALVTAFAQYAVPACTAATLARAVCKVAARRLVSKALQHRKKYAGRRIKTIREISDLPLKGVEEFGDREHTVSSEPYYYDTAYHPVKRHSSIPVDENGKCIVAEVIASAKVSTKI